MKSLPYQITTVIPVFNESINIINVLNGLYKLSNNKNLLILVDNNSQDDTLKIIEKWKQTHPNFNLKILSEKKQGAMHARLKGINHAITNSKIIISLDADVIIPKSFFDLVKKDFINKPNIDILRGRVLQAPSTRLYKMIYLTNLMKALLYYEQVEKQLFGNFFFGGYFAIKTSKFSNKAFTDKNIPLPEEATVFWSHRCYYLGNNFATSKNYVRVSDRRFWGDPDGSISGKRNVALRKESFSETEKDKIITNLQGKEERLIRNNNQYFAHKLLFLALDAQAFKKITSKHAGKKANNAISRFCNYFNIDETEFKSLVSPDINRSKQLLTKKYSKNITKTLSENYLLQPHV